MEKKYSVKILSRQRIRAGLAAFVMAGLVMGAYGTVSAEPAENPAGTGPGITIGKGSVTESETGISIGSNAKTNNTNIDDAIAIGHDAEASYGSIVIGKGTRDHDGKGTGSTYSVIIGNDAQSLGGGGGQVILGSDSSGKGTEAMALGSGTEADGEKSIAIGSLTSATGENSTALGGASEATGKNSTAIGAQAVSQAEDALALGGNSNAQVYRGVALGSFSVANREGFTEEKKGVFSDFDLNGKTLGAVSVGQEGYLRQIINVGDATEDTDAVNLRQLKKVASTADEKITALNGKVNRAGAGAAALAGLHPLDYDPDNKFDFAAGYGNYKGANALAIGAFYRPDENKMISIGGSFGGGENMVSAGVSVKLGQGTGISTSKVAMAKEISELKEENREMKKEIEVLKEQMQKLLAGK